MKNTFIRLLGLALVFVMAFSLFVGCGSNETETKTEETETKVEENTEAGEVKDTIIIATANEPPTLHPYEHSAIAASYMNLLTFDYFMRTNVDTLEPEVGVITAWENPSDLE